MNSKKTSLLCRGFSLIELISALAIVVILTLILIPLLGSMRDKAQTAKSIGNLKQIGQAIFLYTNDNEGVLPVFCEGAPTWSWRAPFWNEAIIPYLGQAYYGGWVGHDGAKIKTHPSFISPLLPNGSHDPNGSDYAANRGVIIFRAGQLTLAEIAEPSRKVMLLSVLFDGYKGSNYFNSDNYWYSPDAERRQPSNFGAEGDVPLLFVDGHVELLAPDKIREERGRLFLVNTN